MTIPSQAEKAENFRKLHFGPRILALPNAWDVASARILEEAGYPAIGTTSAGIAFSLGYPDGQQVPRSEMLEVVTRIAHSVKVPVSADMESGYGQTPGEMQETARGVIAAGAVGLNLEDLTGDSANPQVNLALQVEKIRAIRETAQLAGVRLVLNARTDIYLHPIGEAGTRFRRTVDRLRAYREAGADCLFAPGVSDRATISQLVTELASPLNILVSPEGLSLEELEDLGVARVSAGSSLMRVALGAVRRAGKEWIDTGSYRSLLESAVPYADLNRMMARGNS